jgi:preprotein translocase subunit SecD
MVVSLVLMVLISFGSLFLTLAAGWGPKLGLDLAGGVQVVFVPAQHRSLTPAQLAVSEQIIRNRVAGFGVSGATVTTQGNPPQVIVQMPGVKDPRQVIADVGKTAQLLMRPVLCFAYPEARLPHGEHAASPFRVPACTPTFALDSSVNPHFVVSVQPGTVQGYSVSNVPPDPQYVRYPSINVKSQAHPGIATLTVIENGLKGQPAYPGLAGSRYVVGPAELTGTAIATATATQNQAGEWVVDCTLTSAGAVQWDTVAQRHFHQYLAIDLDGVVQSAPLIQPTNQTFQSFQGQVEISGNFTQASANALATVLQYGSLPVPLVVLYANSVSPTLGHSALVAGLGAALAGLILVLLYVILYYRLLGLVVIAGLAVTAALLWAIISALGQTSVAPTFDLAGVTGLIVSIGITVDSYIVYFERLKDETRAGRSVRTSLDRGFASAWRTVLAADTVSLLAAVLLYFLAVGTVQGFAFFLGLSTILDIVVTWFFTRPAVSLLGRSERLASLRGMGIERGLAVTRAPGVPA